ncbi:MAG: hypothetical protein QXS91_01190 [Candidatus Anstonellales archaeon]
MFLELVDTTLRDGEQVYGLSYKAEEKFIIGRFILEKLRIDRLECASALTESDKKAVSMLSTFANDYLKKPFCVEVLAFLNKESIDWAYDAGCRTVNILAKGSKQHLTKQLKLDEKGHKELIEYVFNYAKDREMRVNIYLEDVSYGIQENKDYVYGLLEFLEGLEPNRVMLPDTRGILCPSLVNDLFKPVLKEFSKLIFDFHGHNDYGLALANSIEAANIGFNGIHGTINGMGERTGNTPLEELIVAIKDFTKRRVNAQEKHLYTASLIVQKFSGKSVAFNKPIVGEYAFTHTAGIHADGERKAGLYTSRLSPARFGREKQFSIGKLSGKANIKVVLEELGINISDEEAKVLKEKISTLAGKKLIISEADIIYLLGDIKKDKNITRLIKIHDIGIEKQNEKYVCKMKMSIKENEEIFEEKQDNLLLCILEIIKKASKKHGFFVPFIDGYEIADNGGLVLTTIKCKSRKGKIFKTYGNDSDLIKSFASAIEKAVNYENIALK